MTRILFVSHSATWGGAEKCLALLLDGLPRGTHEAQVVFRRRPWAWAGPTGLEVFCRRHGIAAWPADLKWWARDWPHDAAFAHGLPQRVAALERLIALQRPDAVVTNTSVVVEGALAARRVGVPHIWHVLEMLSRDPVLRPFLPLPRFYELIDRLSARIVVVSAAVRAEIEQFAPAAKLTIVHTGLPPAATTTPADKPRSLGVPADAVVVTFVGLLSRRKGVVELIEAAGQLADRFPQARLVLVGRDGGERRALVRRIRALGLDGTVRLLGPRDDVPAVLAASDLFVLPSLADPLPVAVLEAMSHGLPVIATRSGGCEEMVADGETGLLVPPGDAAALAAALGQLLGDPARRQQMGQLGRARFETHFSQRAYVAAFMRTIDDAVAAGKSAGGASLAGTDEVDAILGELQSAAARRAAQRRRESGLWSRCYEWALTLAYRLRLVR